MTPPRSLVAAASVALLAAVAGALSSAATALVHHYWWGLAWGVVAGVLAVRALPARWWGRPLFVGAWLVVTYVVLAGRPEGDFLVADTVEGYLYLGSGLLLVLVAVTGRSGPRPQQNVPSAGASSYTR